MQDRSTQNDSFQLVALYWPVFLIALSFGLLLSFGVLSGDDKGRVNILFLLFIFVAFPILGFLISLFGNTIGKDVNSAKLIQKIASKIGKPSDTLMRVRNLRIESQWLLLQSQYAAIGYAFGSFIGLLILLLVSDINFVWRSTLLTPEHLLPSLEFIALPWFFWESAQPNLDLLVATQDSRIIGSTTEFNRFADWWPFIVASLVTYSFFLRYMLLIILRIKIVVSVRKSQSKSKSDLTNITKNTGEVYGLSDVVNQFPADFARVNWSGFSDEVINQLAPQINSAKELRAGPLASLEEQKTSQLAQQKQVVLVKAWEPPLGELGDYLKQTRGIVYPVELQGSNVTVPNKSQLNEWRRFVANYSGWKIYYSGEDK